MEEKAATGLISLKNSASVAVDETPSSASCKEPVDESVKTESDGQTKCGLNEENKVVIAVDEIVTEVQELVSSPVEEVVVDETSPKAAEKICEENVVDNVEEQSGLASNVENVKTDLHISLGDAADLSPKSEETETVIEEKELAVDEVQQISEKHQGDSCNDEPEPTNVSVNVNGETHSNTDTTVEDSVDSDKNESDSSNLITEDDSKVLIKEKSNVQSNSDDNPSEEKSSDVITIDLEEVPTDKIDKTKDSYQIEVIHTSEEKTYVINDSNKTLVESIASDWSFSDDLTEVPTVPQSNKSNQTKKSNSEQESKSSAEIIAMEWEDHTDTVNSVEEKSVSNDSEVITESTNENENTEENVLVVEGAADEVICTVVEGDQVDKDSDGIIILEELSELTVDPEDTREITIIAIDENSKIISPALDIVTEFPVESPGDTGKVGSDADDLDSQVDEQKSQTNSKESTEASSKINFPAHLLGRTVKNPASDTSWKGRQLSKPRMGVQVPCRNLTSQICSKDEIQDHVAEMKTISNPDLPPQGDVLFTAKLFNNLAKKIFAKEKRSTEEKALTEMLNRKSAAAPVDKRVSDQELLAILEGDAEIDVYNLQQKKSVLTSAKNVSTGTSTSSSNNSSSQVRRGNKTQPGDSIDPEMAREIALRQLSQLPETHRRRGRSKNVVTTNVPQTRIIENSDKSGDPFTFDETSKTVDDPPKKYEPVPVKTYSRKSNNEEPELEEIPIPKELLDIENNSKPSTSFKTSKSHDQIAFKRKKKLLKNTKTKVRNLKFIGSTAVKKRQTRQSSEISSAYQSNSKDVTNVVLMSKRSRIIKKKVIWDPSSKSTVTNKPETREMKLPAIMKGKVIKQSEHKKVLLRTKKQLVAAAQQVIKERNVVEKQANETPQPGTSAVKRKQPNDGVQMKKKKMKRVTEVDRLLMDEGALNMLYAVEQDEKVPLIKEKQRVISLDKFTKEMSKKKMMIMSALSTTETSPKTLRKKESPQSAPSRKKSRDSVRSSIQSPPPSPNSMFPPRAEASRIIRRHSSSSSFSSECLSPRRLSTVDVVPDKVKTDTTENTEGWIDVPKKSVTNANGKLKNINKIPVGKRGVPIFVKKLKPSKYTGSMSGVSSQTNEQAAENEAEAKLTKDKVLLKTKPNETSNKRDSKGLKKVQEQKADTDKLAEMFENSPTAPVKSAKTVRKESTVKSPSPDSESYSNVVKSLDVDSQRKKVFPVDEKQRTSGRLNAGTYNYKEISIRKYENLVQIILTPQSTKIKNALNLPVMRELCDALATLKKETTCRAVLITSTGSVFCKGLDYTPLIHANAEKRKHIAQEMAIAVKELVRAIAHFPRPIIAGVQGAAYGLGVAILPLCDLVFVSDKATFSMNQSKIGCLPEGAASVTLPHVTSHAVASELLIAGHTLTATEALRHGLASRVLWPEGYFKELIPMCKTIASRSSQSMDATKALIRHALLLKVEAALESETQLLIQHWTSSECQQLFKKALEQDAW